MMWMTGKRTDMEMEADLRAMRRYARALSRDHVVAGDVAAAHVHVHGRHRAHAHVAVASVCSILFLSLDCAVSTWPGPERIVIFMRRCRCAY